MVQSIPFEGVKRDIIMFGQQEANGNLPTFLDALDVRSKRTAVLRDLPKNRSLFYEPQTEKLNDPFDDFTRQLRVHVQGQ